MDLLRQRKRHATAPLEESACGTYENEERLGVEVSAEGASLLAQCILALPANYRQVILLHYRHGYSLKEVARIMGIEYDYARKLNQRAKQKLKELYEQGGGCL